MRTEQQIRPGGQTAYEQYLKSVLSIRPLDQQKLGKIGVDFLRNISTVTIEEIESNFMLPQPLSSQIEGKTACAKLLNSGDVVVDCYQCRHTPVSVVCLNCFKDSDHEGHNYYVIKLEGRFCCKCGDKQAWNQNGFCRQHTGQHSQFAISEQFMKEGRQKLHTLFYIYFYLAATNRRLWMKYSDCLIEFLIKVNTGSLWHNKMTALILKDKLKMDLNPLLNQGTVLENILKYAISQHMIYEWVQLFLLLFAYIPFKSQLLTVYFQKYGELVDGSFDSVNCANLLSIHLLNCDQLILAYSKSYKFGLGQKNNLRPTYSSANDKRELFKSYYIQMFNEINLISSSSHDVILAYWQMYIQYEQGLSPFFQYYEDMLYSVKGCLQKKDRYTVLFQVLQMASLERNAILQFCIVLRAFRKQKDILRKLIQFFWQKCMDQQNHNSNDIIYIFRPYERCLGLTIFAYFELQFNNLNQQQIIEQVFKNDKDGFHKLMNIVLPKILKTYFFSALLHSEPGLIQPLREYMQTYKTNQPFLFQTDIICIKIFIILLGKDFSQSVLEEVKRNIPARSHKKLYFNYVMDYIRYLYTFEMSQARIASIIDPSINIYKMSVADLLERLFYEYKGCVSMQVIRTVKDRLFSKQYQYIHEWVETNCDSNRQRKEVTLKANIQLKNKGLDFNDFWQSNLHDTHRDPWKTVDSITKYGRRSTSNVSYYLWNEKSLAELHAWYKTLYRPDSQQGVQEIFMNVLHIYLLKKEANQELVDIQRDIINPNVHLLSPVFRRKFYNQPQPLQIKAVYIRDGIMQEYPLGQQPYPSSSQSSPLYQKLSDHNSENLEPYQYSEQFSQPNQQEQQEQQAYRPPPPPAVQQNEQTPAMPKPQKNLSIKQLKQYKKKIILENRRRRLQGLSQLERQPPINQNTNAVRVEQQQKYQCCVCKEENKNDLVYLIKLDSRNSEFILNLGEGVGCLSYISCFHIFCIGCIKGIIQQKYVMECQVCHAKPTFILPLTNIEQSNNQVIMKKIREAASKRMNFISVQHTIIVSFYHFVLLCYVDINNAKSKRAHLYKIMLNQLLFYVGEQNSRAIARARLWRVFSYLKTERIYHQIYNAKQTKQSENLIKQQEQDSDQSEQVECSWDKQMSFISEGDNYKRKFDIAMSVLKIFFKARTRNQRTSQQKLQKAINRFQDKYFVKLCIMCFKIVFDEQLSQEDQEFIKNYEHPKQIHPIVKIFPSKRQRYFPRLVCTCCGEMSADMTECLLCSQWVGCQKCENGTNQKHIIDAHKGGLGLFMDVQDTKPFYQSWHGVSLEKAVYENFWGEGPSRHNRTQSFDFNPKLIKKIQEILVYDKNIPNFGPKP